MHFSRRCAIHFDGTVQLGALLNVAAILGAAFVLYGRFSSMETKIEAMWTWFTSDMADRRTHERREK